MLSPRRSSPGSRSEHIHRRGHWPGPCSRTPSTKLILIHARVADLLDGIPGAYERALLGREQAKVGTTIPLDDL